MSELRSDVVGVDFKDRKVWLFIFGICQCILGIMCALAIPMTLLSVVMQIFIPNEATNNAGGNVLQMIPALIFYALAAAWFVSLGVASIKCKRWARALTLISSWIWLIGGICGFVIMSSTMSTIFSTMNTQMAAAGTGTGPAVSNQMPAVFFLVMKTVMIGTALVTYVLLPLVLVFFYSGKNVKATCQCWDEKACWTDNIPLPVLGMSFVFVLWGISLPTLAIHNWAFPFFGTVIDSMAGAAASLCFFTLLILLAWRLYKLDAWAWWLSVALVITWFTSLAMTFAGDSVWEYYEKFATQPKQMEILKTSNIQSMMVIMFGILGIGLTGYLIWIKRHFGKDTQFTQPQKNN